MPITTSTSFDLYKLRADTPGCTDNLFVNSAGASLMPQPVIDAMTEYFRQETQLGGYEAERLQADRVANFYTETARLLNAQPRTIAFSYSATDAYIQALSAIPFRAGDVILTTSNDYISNQLAFLSLQRRVGIKVIRINDLPNGDLDLTHLEEQIQAHRPALVAITHVPTNSGLVQPAEAIGAICRRYEVWYLLDAAQSAGQLPIDVTRIQPDFLVATGRKFLRGPRNTGFLYVADRVLEAGLAPMFIDRRGASWTGPDSYELQASARRFEPQEMSMLSVGLVEAVRYANQVGIDQIVRVNQQLMHRLRTGLASIDGLVLMDRGSVQSNILTFSSDRQSLPALEATLRRERILFTSQQRQSSLIDFTSKGIDWIIRLSPHYFNTLDEMNAIIDVVNKAVQTGK